MNCKTCKHWNPEGFGLNATGNQSPDSDKNVPAGTCRRYAPSARANNWRSWPVTIATDFCHDYVMTEAKAVEPAKVTTITHVDEPQTPPKLGYFKSRKKGA